MTPLDTSPTRQPLVEQLDAINANMPVSGMPLAMAVGLLAGALDDILTRLDWQEPAA